jgi:hypothetical protein
MQYDNAVFPVLTEEPGWYSWYSCWLQAEWSGDRIPAGGEEGKILLANQTNPKAQPAYVQWVASLSQVLKWPQCGADHQPSPSTGLQWVSAIPPPPLHATDVME